MNNARSNRHFNELSSEETLINLLVEKSGNSNVDVDVVVEADTMPVAYAILIAQWSSGKLSDTNFERAVQKLEELTGQHSRKKNRGHNDLSNVRLFKKK